MARQWVRQRVPSEPKGDNIYFVRSCHPCDRAGARPVAERGGEPGVEGAQFDGSVLVRGQQHANDFVFHIFHKRFTLEPQAGTGTSDQFVVGKTQGVDVPQGEINRLGNGFRYFDNLTTGRSKLCQVGVVKIGERSGRLQPSGDEKPVECLGTEV